MKKISGILILLIVGALLSCSNPATGSPAKFWVVSILAGTAGQSGHSNSGDGSFNDPSGIAVDNDGNVYVADYTNHRIRKITKSENGVYTKSTFAGSSSGDQEGTGASARFRFPTGVAVDKDGNVYVADYGNHKIRKITPGREMTTIAGSGTSGSDNHATDAKSATFNRPYGVAVDEDGNVYVADKNNHRIRKITKLESGGYKVDSFAGSEEGRSGSDNGTGADAKFFSPQGMAMDSSGNVYVADLSNHSIRKITPQGEVSTFAGSGTPGDENGVAGEAQFDSPRGIAVDAAGIVYVADSSNHLIRKITPGGVVTTIAGSTEGVNNGYSIGAKTRFKHPIDVATDSSGNVYVADTGNHLIRKIEYE